MLVANGLELKKIQSKVVIISEIDDLKKTVSSYFESPAYAVAYLTNEVLIGKFINGEFEFYQNKKINPDYLIKLRIFNLRQELLVWQTEEGLKGRLRIDEEGEETHVVDARQVLWGTDKEDYGNGWTRIFEERGTQLILPFSKFTVDNKKNRLFIRTRNYVHFNSETHLATYNDCRFIEFLDSKNQLK
ncbi:CRISPR-associated protein Csx19 [Thermodesulfovibrio sp. 3907-1M]|uniref:CRISPR-associated protein Csx19 n=1 Tax=Thermodesulfovibrio autotrophicus TaxID=3118333 RepID=A0AAU8GYD5_9BACT